MKVKTKTGNVREVYREITNWTWYFYDTHKELPKNMDTKLTEYLRLYRIKTAKKCEVDD